MKGNVTSIYVVAGRTGEYSDRREWMVRAFKSRDAAETLRAELLKLVRGLGCGRGDRNARDFPSHYPEEINTEKEYEPLREGYNALIKLDAGFRTTYTGTDYIILEAPMEEA